MQHIKYATLKKIHQGSSTLITRVQTCDSLWHRCANTCSISNLSAGTRCNEAQGEAESSPMHRMSTLVFLLTRRISSISPHSTAAVFFSRCGGVLTRQQPLSGVLRVRPTLGAAEECGAEACAERPSQQDEHDAVSCSLRGVPNSLLGPDKSIQCLMMYRCRQQIW